MPVPTTNALTPPKQQIPAEALASYKRSFDQRTFFRRLAADEPSPAVLKYVFGQYGNFRMQLRRWFAVCIILARHASQSVQREAILVLADVPLVWRYRLCSVVGTG